MVSLQDVRAHKASLKNLGPGLVAVFVGGTSGIGLYTAREFVRYTISPRVYLVGRNEVEAKRTIDELHSLNLDGKVQFIKSDVSLLKGVDKACDEILRTANRVNLLFLSCGMMSTGGRDACHYYARMRFINRLLRRLARAAGDDSNPSLSRVVSVLGAGHESKLYLDDLDLKKNYSVSNCAGQATSMTSLIMGEFARRHPSTTFIHAYPGIVKSGIARGLGPMMRYVAGALMFLGHPWMVPQRESGERNLFASTSELFSPAGISEFQGESSTSAIGADGVRGSGAYLVHWDGSEVGKEKVLRVYQEGDVSETVWEHTLEVLNSC
ncbi:uncharacterized protein BDW43DRAFT_312799 [Aspergillus alliaceus]|uniref:uncharacterized protein n=1 Tax=Petromyces alliaceus TaxID=209559 RepID=UPI0012A3FFE8|nr:uncharacterized protein BDW43DRAFT_312799 [Aspergillus alliaceus]KAB8231571.1 hypothetical protein BDW43DRAFT_312799 [Aspergillus alliaceus]